MISSDVLQNGLNFATSVLKLGDNLFAGDQAWMEYRMAVRKLERILKQYQETIEELESEPPDLVTKSLEDAEFELERAHIQLQYIERRCGCCCLSFASSYAFPEALKQRTQFLKDLPQGIKNDLTDWKDFKELVGFAREGRKIESDNPSPDARYVPLEDYQDDIYAALKNNASDAPLVIFLHGERGIGKTTIAWHTAADASKTHGERGIGKTTIAWHTAADASKTHDDREAADASRAHANDEASQSLSFRHVFFIPCGTWRTDAEEKLEEELKSRLGLKPEAKSRDISIALKNAKILIILDDVQDSAIPGKIIALGGRSKKGLKVFINSNRAALCDPFDPSKIHKVHMHTILNNKATKILASHCNLRLTEGDLSDQMKGVTKIMDEVINKTAGHPLALACFANALRKDHVKDLQEWENAMANFEGTLGLKSHVQLYSTYPRSFWGLMEYMLETSIQEERVLLLLLSTLEPKVVSEQDIQSLYISLGLGEKERFNNAVPILRERHLISTVSYSWSIHPLMKRYLEVKGVYVFRSWLREGVRGSSLARFRWESFLKDERCNQRESLRRESPLRHLDGECNLKTTDLGRYIRHVTEYIGFKKIPKPPFHIVDPRFYISV